MESADTSQPNPTPPAADTSLPGAPTAHVTDVAPVDTTTTPAPNPPQATAGTTTGDTPAAGPEGVPGGVDTTKEIDPAEDYAAAKAAFFNAASNPATVQQPPPGAASGEPSSAAPAAAAPATGTAESTQPPAAADQTRLPKVPIRPHDAADMAILQDWKQHGQGKSLVDFILEKKTPVAPAKPNEAGGTGEVATPPAADLPDGTKIDRTFSSVEAIDAEILRLVDQEYVALGNFDADAAKAYRLEGERLRALRGNYQSAETLANKVQQTAAEMEWAEDLGRAQKLFPTAGVEGSPLEAKAAEIRAEWIRTGHPLAQSPRSALAIYSEASLALGLSPAAPAASAPPPSVSTPPGTPSIHRPPAGIIASGDARSTPPRPTEEITPENYHEQKARMLGVPARR